MGGRRGGRRGVGGYAALVCAAWMRFGRPAQPQPDEVDPWLDRFMPSYDVAERHHAHVHAPAEVVLESAKAARLQDSPLVRAIIRARFSPGIVLIRHAVIAALTRDAEQRASGAREAVAARPAPP